LIALGPAAGLPANAGRVPSPWRPMTTGRRASRSPTTSVLRPSVPVRI
jgi:hypothetical protein